MENPFAKFFGKNNKLEKSEAPITVDGKPLEDYKLSDGIGLEDEYSEVCECGEKCDYGEDCHSCDDFDDRGVVEKQAGNKHPGGTLANNAKLAKLNKGYVKLSKGVKARNLSKIIFKKS